MRRCYEKKNRHVDCKPQEMRDQQLYRGDAKDNLARIRDAATSVKDYIHPRLLFSMLAKQIQSKEKDETSLLGDVFRVDHLLKTMELTVDKHVVPENFSEAIGTMTRDNVENHISLIRDRLEKLSLITVRNTTLRETSLTESDRTSYLKLVELYTFIDANLDQTMLTTLDANTFESNYFQNQVGLLKDLHGKLTHLQRYMIETYAEAVLMEAQSIQLSVTGPSYLVSSMKTVQESITNKNIMVNTIDSLRLESIRTRANLLPDVNLVVDEVENVEYEGKYMQVVRKIGDLKVTGLRKLDELVQRSEATHPRELRPLMAGTNEISALVAKAEFYELYRKAILQAVNAQKMLKEVEESTIQYNEFQQTFDAANDKIVSNAKKIIDLVITHFDDIISNQDGFGDAAYYATIKEVDTLFDKTDTLMQMVQFVMEYMNTLQEMKRLKNDVQDDSQQARMALEQAKVHADDPRTGSFEMQTNLDGMKMLFSRAQERLNDLKTARAVADSAGAATATPDPVQPPAETPAHEEKIAQAFTANIMREVEADDDTETARKTWIDRVQSSLLPLKLSEESVSKGGNAAYYFWTSLEYTDEATLWGAIKALDNEIQLETDTTALVAKRTETINVLQPKMFELFENKKINAEEYEDYIQDVITNTSELFKAGKIEESYYMDYMRDVISQTPAMVPTYAKKLFDSLDAVNTLWG